MRSLPYALFICILFFAPLAFGSVETWSIALVEISICLATLSYLFVVYREKLLFFHVPGITPLLLLLLWIALQLISLPPGLVQVIAPGIHQAYNPILELQDSSKWIPLTVNHKATLLEFLRISSYALFYILTVQLLSQSKRLTKTVRIIAWLAMTIAFLAIIQKFTSPHHIYWFRPTPENAGTVGPWIYHNHYAGFMELVFPLVLALFFYYHPKFTSRQSMRARIVSIFTSPGSNFHFFLGFGVILILASVFIALSRGGTISIVLGLFFFLTLLARKNTGHGKALPLIVLGCALLAVTWFGWDPILSKFNISFTETGGLSDGRLLIWQDCAPLIRDFLFTGSGFGTFINVFPQYNTIPNSAIFDHAHNDYIELITDGGIIGFILAACFVITIMRHGFKRLKVRRDKYSIFVSIAGLTALFSILLHSVTDFNMHNGANGLYFFFLCGIVISAGNTRLHFRTRPTLLKPASPTIKLIPLMAIPLLFMAITYQSGILKAKGLYKQTSQVYLNPLLPDQTLQTLLNTVNNAISADPMEGLYSYYKGNLLSYMKDNDAAFSSYLHAARKDPLEGAYLQRLGLLLTATDNANASRLMAEGYARSQNKKELIFSWAEWLLNQNRISEATAALQEGVERFPELSRRLPALLLRDQFTREEIKMILPQKASAWILIGDLAEKMGKTEDVEYYRIHALDFLEQEETILPWYFNQIYWFYRKQNRTEDAVAILRKGIKYLPNHAPFHLWLGDYYKEQNIFYRAKEEYKQALILEPGNEKISKRLQTLE
jgi:O-antigen ligase/tetratricopeptide (TPR) repeat protein